VQSTLRQKWKANEAYDDDDSDEMGAEEDTNTAEQLKSQLTQEIRDLCEIPFFIDFCARDCPVHQN